MGRRHHKSLEERIQDAIDDARERKRKAKRKYKSDWETAKNRRLRKAEKEADAAEHLAAVEAAIQARQAFEAKYADIGIVKHVSPAKIKRQIPKPKKLKTAAEIETQSLWYFNNRDKIKDKRRERDAAKKAKKVAMKKKESTIK